MGQVSIEICSSMRGPSSSYVRGPLEYLYLSTPYETYADKDDAFAGHELWFVQKDGDLRK
jgi:hypothetical protein